MRVLLRGVPLTVPAGTEVTFKVSLLNGTATDQRLTLPSGKHFSFFVTDPTGRRVLDAEEGSFFTQALTPLDVAAGDEVRLGKVTWAVPTNAPPGVYHAHAAVEAMDGRWETDATFEIPPADRPGHELG
ncbi:MAG TPA: BsuPI-related putative proteinase inhibitor [Candidatus Thermoplasmatota archaeon]|nr:BsuPI-related putative proteinase inhibitor [Candidatus Thermoplasmatota archaeon]